MLVAGSPATNGPGAGAARGERGAQVCPWPALHALLVLPGGVALNQLSV